MLNLAEVKSRAPAVFAETHPMSNRYGQIHTHRALEVLADNGYLPVDASQSRAQKRNPNFVNHMVVLRHENDLEARSPQVPQILLYNSHNGRTAMRMFVGMYRFVCSNGLVVGNDMYAYALRHNLEAAKQIGDFLSNISGHASELSNVVDLWSRRELTEAQAIRFAREAAVLRFGNSAGAYEPTKLLEARRAEDEGRTLWKVYNAVQENTMKGGIEGRNANSRRVTSKPLTQIHANINYNRQLWQLAEQLAA
jgi:hypothetical protein